MEPISNAHKTFFKHFSSFHFFLNIISQPLLFRPIEKKGGKRCQRRFKKKEVKTSQKTICKLKFPMFTDPDLDLDTILRVSYLTMILTLNLIMNSYP